jgi:4-hydroxythreonine-4-phosphate dehydrogenase
VSLRSALELITPQRVEQAIGLAHRTMRSTGIAAPRIGVAALNPHAGENGLFGDEEIRIIHPSVERVRDSGIDCTGPLPSDTIFLRARAGDFDAVVIMYHDQGQIATKLLGFQNGVTVSAGMRTIYATPAHGTAFDIVGKGRANPGAMTAAFRMAAKLGAARRLACYGGKAPRAG